ncbi:MAG: hypothetical protein V2A77_04615 [Pseudomonadota bacterium]
MEWWLPIVLGISAGFSIGSLAFVLFNHFRQDKAGRGSTVEARQFSLTDDTGRIRAAIGMRADGAPGLMFWDQESNPRASLYLRADGEASLDFYDSGQCRVAVGMNSGNPVVFMWDSDGECRVALNLAADKVPNLTFYGQGGTITSSLLLGPDGVPALHLAEATEACGTLFFGANRQPGLILRDKVGRTIWTAPPCPEINEFKH